MLVNAVILYATRLLNHSEIKSHLETTLFGSRSWFRMGSKQKDNDEGRSSTNGDNGLFEEIVGNLKQSKARYKTALPGLGEGY